MNGYTEDRRRQSQRPSTGVLLAIGAVTGAVGYWLFNKVADELNEEERHKKEELTKRQRGMNSTKRIEPLEISSERLVSGNHGTHDPTLYCPISLELMKDPVIIECGHTFDLANILDYFNKFDDCPLCRQKVDKTRVYRNWSLRQVIEKELNSKCTE